jgi:alpha-L-fucosidase
MNNRRHSRLIYGLLFVFTVCLLSCSDPKPFGPVPTDAQLAWQRMEINMFCHFGPNTFTGAEWGSGQEAEEVFAPKALDCRQWVAVAEQAGMGGIILTAKHHDGFCLWPSAQSSHTVKPGQDVLRQFVDACREGGMKAGVYISPWDRNHPSYGTDAYNDVFVNTLKEVHTNYGPFFEQWFDGACGEGPNGKKQHYDWPRFMQTMHDLNPHAVIFSDIGPGCRWIGNERGRSAETNWSRLDTEGFSPGIGAPRTDTLARGNVHGARWIPAESDVSIRPGWFYSPDTDARVKTVDQLMEIYFNTVGNNANFLLNVPPDRRGRIHPADSARLMEFKAAREAYFADRVASGNRRLVAKIPAGRTARCVVLREDIAHGQKIASFVLEARQDGVWNEIARGTTVGHKKILRFDPCAAEALRVRVLQSYAPAKITSMEVY